MAKKKSGMIDRMMHPGKDHESDELEKDPDAGEGDQEDGGFAAMHADAAKELTSSGGKHHHKKFDKFSKGT